MINYSETFQTITPESAEFGDYAESGFISESESATFRDMVELLTDTEPSCFPVSDDGNIWFSDNEYGNGTREYYESGELETRSYHPKTSRDARYMVKAWKYANG